MSPGKKKENRNGNDVRHSNKLLVEIFAANWALNLGSCARDLLFSFLWQPLGLCELLQIMMFLGQKIKYIALQGKTIIWRNLEY